MTTQVSRIEFESAASVKQPSGSERLREAAEFTYHKVQQCIQDEPQKAMLWSLGAGLGIGLVTGLLLGGRREPDRKWYGRLAADDIGERIYASIQNVIPDALSRHLSKS